MSFNVSYVANDKVNVETKEKTLGMDLQRIDTKSLEDNGEILPVKSTKVYEQLVRGYEIRDNTQHNITLDLSVLEKCRNFDFIIRHDLDTDLRLALRYDGPSIGNKVGDSLQTLITPSGDFKKYGVASSQIYHIIKEDTEGIFGNIYLGQTKLSQDVDKDSEKPFKFFKPINDIQIMIRAETAPTKGGISVSLVGDTL